jgi:hypothetical protein
LFAAKFQSNKIKAKARKIIAISEGGPRINGSKETFCHFFSNGKSNQLMDHKINLRHISKNNKIEPPRD